MIGPSGGAPDRHGEADRQDAAGAEPLPFSHDSHFSVSAQSAPGYRLHAIDEIIVIGGNGRIVGVESPGFIAGERRRKGAMPAPVATLSKGQVPLRFLWGPVRSVLGVSGTSPGSVETGRALEDHLKFKALHHRVLEGVGDIALQAFLRFLDHQMPSAGEVPALAERPNCKLAFRFQYDEHYLHERHAAQLAWKRFLNEAAPSGDPPSLR